VARLSEIPGQMARSSDWGRRPVLRRLIAGQFGLDDIWCVMMPALALCWLGLTQISPSDFWWHLRTGQVILATHRIPTVDLFTFSRAGMPWMNQSWLTQIALYELYIRGGEPLVIFAHALAIAASYALLLALCLMLTAGSARAAALATFAAMALGMFEWGLRPQTASFPCFALLLWLLLTAQPGTGRQIWLLPVLFALWSNLHGAFVFGLAFLMIYVASHVIKDVWQQRRVTAGSSRLLVVAVLCILAVSLSPAGPLGMTRYVLGFAQSNATLNLNQEFLPLNVRELPGQILLAAILTFVVLLYRRRNGLPVEALPALALFGVGSLYAQRTLPWFGMILAPYLALVIESGHGRDEVAFRPGKPRMNYALGALLAGLVVLTLPWVRPYLPLPPEARRYIAERETPVRAVAQLCTWDGQVRPFNDVSYGSYIAWACPRVKVFMDPRFELYPPEMWEDYIAASLGQFGWEQRLDKYGVNAILADKREQPTLVEAARAAVKWELAYEDDNVALFRLRGNQGS
jgi:hypothetical protein